MKTSLAFSRSLSLFFFFLVSIPTPMKTASCREHSLRGGCHNVTKSKTDVGFLPPSRDRKGRTASKTSQTRSRQERQRLSELQQPAARCFLSHCLIYQGEGRSVHVNSWMTVGVWAACRFTPHASWRLFTFNTAGNHPSIGGSPSKEIQFRLYSNLQSVFS